RQPVGQTLRTQAQDRENGSQRQRRACPSSHNRSRGSSHVQANAATRLVNSGPLTATKVCRVAFVGCRVVPLPTTKCGSPHNRLSPSPRPSVGPPTTGCPPPHDQVWVPPQS